MTFRLAVVVAILAMLNGTRAGADEEAAAVAASNTAKANWITANEKLKELRDDRDRAVALGIGLSERYQKMCGQDAFAPGCNELRARMREENRDRIAAENAYQDYIPVEEKAEADFHKAEKKKRDIQFAKLNTPKPPPEPTPPMPSPFSGAGPVPPQDPPTPMPEPFSGAGPALAPPAVTGRRGSDGSLTCYYRDGSSSWNFTTRDPSFKDCPVIPPGYRPIDPNTASAPAPGSGAGGSSIPSGSGGSFPTTPTSASTPTPGGPSSGSGFGGPAPRVPQDPRTAAAPPGFGSNVPPLRPPGGGSASNVPGASAPGWNNAPGANNNNTPGANNNNTPGTNNNRPNAGPQGGGNAPNTNAAGQGPQQPQPPKTPGPIPNQKVASTTPNTPAASPEKGGKMPVTRACIKSATGPNYDCVWEDFCVGKPGTAAAAKPFVQCRECKTNECDPWMSSTDVALCPANVTSIQQCQHGDCDKFTHVPNGGPRYTGESCKPGGTFAGTLPPYKPKSLPLRVSAAPMAPHPQPVLPPPMVHQPQRPIRQAMQHPQKQHPLKIPQQQAMQHSQKQQHPQKIPQQQAMQHPQKQHPQKIPQQQAMQHPQKQHPQKIPQQQAMQHPQKQQQPQKANLGPSNKYANLGSQNLKQNYKPQSLKQQGYKKQGYKQQGVKQQGFKQAGLKQQGFKQQGLRQQGFKQSNLKQASGGAGGHRKRFR
jgi:hypothetical protein